MFTALIAAVQIASLQVPLVRKPDWRAAAHVSLDWDLQGHKHARERTTAYVETDGTYVYVGFRARQREPIAATQHADGVGEGTDDEVEIALWPGGSNGFAYRFDANPIGTHYQASSENSAYSPLWWSTGKIERGGYAVTMKIPLAALHGAGAAAWRVQFSRRVQSTGDLYVWSYSADETDPRDVFYAGTMSGVRSVRTRLRPRIETYGLAALAAPSAGGSTSRAGVDLSIPFTGTSSFYATVHPDYSNVELDQQSISPTAFRRYYSEVRPFFTQGDAAYGNFDCNLCPGGAIQTLYTPSIPTPRYGYAAEGEQGAFLYGAFDAAGVARSDSAQTVTWRNRSHSVDVSLQRTAVARAGFADNTVEIGTSVNDGKHLSAYANYAIESGTAVPDTRRAQYYDAGSAYSTPTTTAGFAVRKIGSYFSPADGFVSHPGIAGYAAFAVHSWLFPKGAAFRSISAQTTLSRYHGENGSLNDTSQNATVDLLTRGLTDVTIGTGSAYVRFSPSGTFYPVSQSGVTLTFGSGAHNESVSGGVNHGTSATPTSIGFHGGRFGDGRLDSLTFTSTVRAMKRGLLTFETDANIQRLDGGGRRDQWLERLSYVYEANRDTSLAFGVRRIFGVAPALGAPAPYVQAWNVSAAYHRTWNGTDELYAAYGDASALSTVPGFFVKWIHYAGAGKGS